MRKRSFSRKLFLSYAATFLCILIVMLLIMTSYLYTVQRADSQNTQSQIVSKTQEQIDYSLQSMDRIIQGILATQSFLDAITGDDSQAMDNDDFITMAHTLDAPLFSTYRILACSEDALFVYPHAPDDGGFLAEKLKYYPWRSDIVLGSGNNVTLSPHTDILSSNGTRIYSIARSIQQDGESIGFVEVQSEYSNLETYCDIDSSVGSIAVFAPNGNIVFPKDGRVSANFLHNIFSVIEDQPEASRTVRFHFANPDEVLVGGPPESVLPFGGYNAQISYSKSSYSGWITVMYAPMTVALSFLPELLVFSIAVFILAALLLFVVMHTLTRRLTAPLVDLDAAVSKVSYDNLSLVLPESYGILEIENINRSFRLMFQKLREAIGRNIQVRAEKERANYLALEAQMNPHTLYNTIAMIESVAYMNGDWEASDLCMAFSRMLRYISDYTKREYTLQDELDYLASYNALILKRYEGILEINVRADPALLTKKIPKFTIQPLVENAVRHAISDAHSCLTIYVTAERVAGGWHILVRDNGPGFDPQQREALYRRFAEYEESLQSGEDILNQKIGNMALRNIYIRCSLFFGNAFQISLENTSDTPGAQIELLILQEDTTSSGESESGS